MIAHYFNEGNTMLAENLVLDWASVEFTLRFVVRSNLQKTCVWISAVAQLLRKIRGWSDNDNDNPPLSQKNFTIV